MYGREDGEEREKERKGRAPTKFGNIDASGADSMGHRGHVPHFYK